MATYKVVVTDYEYSSLEIEKEVLQDIDVQFITAQCRTEDDVMEACQDADAIINQYAPISERVIQQLNQCKVISRYGVGVDTIHLEAATKKGIIVCNVADYCIDEVSDHALALLFAWSRKIVALNQDIKAGNWDYKEGAPIYRFRGRTLGLVGFGKIPQALAAKAQVLGLEVIAYDPYIPLDVAEKSNVKLVDLATLCCSSDYISVHAPLNEKTRGLISSDQFSIMKQDAIIINTARGPLIDEAALIDALQAGKIAGAALDVIEREPITTEHPFLHMSQVILTPHVAWYSEEAQRELQRKTAQNVADVLKGKFPAYIVNHKVKDKVSLKA